MKKNILIALLVFFTSLNMVYAKQRANNTPPSDIKQKACENVFSFINLDVSVFSPSLAATDISVKDDKTVEAKKEETVPVANKRPPKKPENRTSLFRLDLLHIIKIQLL